VSITGPIESKTLLNGLRFESDASLTRNDYYLANGNDHSFNGTLFKMMTDTAASTSSAAAPYVLSQLLTNAVSLNSMIQAV
jgi:hypothetical protein